MRATIMLALILTLASRVEAQPASPLAKALRRIALQARALDALTRRHALDYRYPMTPAPAEHDARDRYLALCEDGEGAACWHAADLDGWAADGGAVKRVVERCRGGELASCRALPGGLVGGEALPGHGGRDDACRGEGVCDFALLQRECADGFLQSCAVLAGAANSREYQAVIQRAVPLGRADCSAGIVQQCDAVAALTSDSLDAERYAMQGCPFVRAACAGLPRIYKDRGELAPARNVAERVCQYGVRGSDLGLQRKRCLELADAYAQHVYPEPVTGRGQALKAWVCKDPMFHEHEPGCQ